jgi:hypothetical protein
MFWCYKKKKELKGPFSGPCNMTFVNTPFCTKFMICVCKRGLPNSVHATNAYQVLVILNHVLQVLLLCFYSNCMVQITIFWDYGSSLRDHNVLCSLELKKRKQFILLNVMGHRCIFLCYKDKENWPCDEIWCLLEN